MKIILSIDRPEELKTRLAELDIKVPARSNDRTTKQVERYCIAHLLATLPVERLSFPLTVSNPDKPDFVLHMPTGDIGIEHIEAVPENVAHAQFLREKECLGSEVYFTPHAIPGEPRKIADELRREIENDDPGDGWAGDAPEHKWANAMAYSVEKKLHKANAYTRYPTNWLMIYDNWPLPHIDSSKAIQLLYPLLMNLNAFSVFDTIFILDDSQMYELQNNQPIVYKLVKSQLA
jgi:hypothetical protein